MSFLSSPTTITFGTLCLQQASVPDRFSRFKSFLVTFSKSITAKVRQMQLQIPCFAILKKIWKKKIFLGLKTHKFFIAYSFWWPMPAFQILSSQIQILFWTYHFCIRSLYVGLLFYLSCINLGICSNLNWPIKVFIRFILGAYSCSFKNYSKKMILYRRLRQTSWKKVEKKLIGFFITKAFSIFLKSLELS